MVIGPPEGPNVLGSFRVRSGLIGAKLEPSSVDLKTTLDPTYMVLGSWGDSTMGKVHCIRYLASTAEWPIGLSGQGLISRVSPLLRSRRVSNPP